MKRLLPFLLLFTLLIPMTAGADMGPKPSVSVEFRGLEGQTYYATLLSQTDSTGPWSHSDEYYDYYGDPDVWEAFNGYEDPDGFYFIGCYEDCSDDQTFSWTYYPPQVFKALVYFPESDTFAVTEDTYERYAFDSYFKVNAAAALEGLVYAATLKKWDRDPEKKRHPWVYALTANGTSFALGLFLAHQIPGIF